MLFVSYVWVWGVVIFFLSVMRVVGGVPCLCVVVGPGLVSILPDFMRSSASHPSGPHVRLAHIVGAGGFDTICNRRDSSTTCRMCRLVPFYIFNKLIEFKLREHIRTSNFELFKKSIKTMLFTQQHGSHRRLTLKFPDFSLTKVRTQ